VTAKLILYVIVGLAVIGILTAIHHSIYTSGVRDTQAAQLVAIKKACGDQAKAPADCYTAGIESVKKEYTAKITTANLTIQAQSDALATANTSIDTLRADSARRAKAASAAIAALEAKAKDAAAQLSAVLAAQPTPGATPCESACSLLRSFSF
jgi:hypothetical protein